MPFEPGFTAFFFITVLCVSWGRNILHSLIFLFVENLNNE